METNTGMAVLNGPSVEFWNVAKEFLRAPHKEEELVLQLQQFLSSKVLEMDLATISNLMNKLKEQYETKWPKTKQGGNQRKRSRAKPYSTLTCNQCKKKRFVSEATAKRHNVNEWNCSQNQEDILFAHCDAKQESTKDKHLSFVKFFSTEFGIEDSKIRSWLGWKNNNGTD